MTTETNSVNQPSLESEQGLLIMVLVIVVLGALAVFMVAG
jgi:hypothetical protein